MIYREERRTPPRNVIAISNEGDTPPPPLRAGYRSKIFDIDTDTDTLSSIPVPERYFFRYQFYEISFNKITLSQKTLVLFFSAC